jgi:ribosomal protein S18 acetylase RimI-like enzyme
MIIDTPTADELKFVYDAWAQSFRKSKWAGCIPNHLYDQVSRETARTIFDRGAVVLVAVTPIAGQEEEFPAVRRVMGFVVAEPMRNTLHFLYVKEKFRGVGIGHGLLEAVVKDFDPELNFKYTHRTNASTRFLGERFKDGWDPVPARMK